MTQLSVLSICVNAEKLSSGTFIWPLQCLLSLVLSPSCWCYNSTHISKPASSLVYQLPNGNAQQLAGVIHDLVFIEALSELHQPTLVSSVIFTSLFNPLLHCSVTRGLFSSLSICLLQPSDRTDPGSDTKHRKVVTLSSFSQIHDLMKAKRTRLFGRHDTVSRAVKDRVRISFY